MGRAYLIQRNISTFLIHRFFPQVRQLTSSFFKKNDDGRPSINQLEHEKCRGGGGGGGGW